MNAEDFQTGQLVVIGDGRGNRQVWVHGMNNTIGQTGRVTSNMGSHSFQYVRVAVANDVWYYEPHTLTPLTAGPVSEEEWHRLRRES